MHHVRLKEFKNYLLEERRQPSKPQLYGAYTRNQSDVMRKLITVQSVLKTVAKWLNRCRIFASVDIDKYDEVLPEDASVRKWPILKRDISAYFEKRYGSAESLTPEDVQELAFCLVSLSTGARFSELMQSPIPRSGAKLQDVHFVRKSDNSLQMVILIDKYKQMRTTDGCPITHLIDETKTKLCPVRMMLLYLELRKVFTYPGSLVIREEINGEYLFDLNKLKVDALMSKIAITLNIDKLLATHNSFRRGFAHGKAYKYVMEHPNDDVTYDDVVRHLQLDVQWTSDSCEVYLQHGDQTFAKTLASYKASQTPGASIFDHHMYLSQLGNGCQLLKQNCELKSVLGEELFQRILDPINALIVDHNNELGPVPPEEENVILDIDTCLNLEPVSYDFDGDRFYSFVIKSSTVRSAEERAFTCSVDNCNMSFNRYQCLRQHNRSVHSEERPFVCTVDGCTAAYKQLHHLKNHTERTHTIEFLLCHVEECGRSFKTIVDLNAHSTVHSNERPFLCSVCGASFKSKRNLATHMVVHSNERPFVCTTCNQSFKRPSELVSHEAVHISQHKCPICESSYETVRELRRHSIVHSDDRPYVCAFPGCGWAFKKSVLLTRHQLVHSEERPFVCKFAGCNKTYKRLWQLAGHLKKNHKG